MNKDRKIKDVRISYTIPIKEFQTYKQPIFWGDMLKTRDIRETDQVIGLSWEEQEESGFGSMKMEDELDTYLIPKITIIRQRPETDEEYFERMKKEEAAERQKEEKERLEYYRLKAKFEE